MVKNKIVLIAEAELHDLALAEWVSKIDTRVETINERTKKHTLEIKELRKQLKKLK